MGFYPVLSGTDSGLSVAALLLALFALARVRLAVAGFLLCAALKVVVALLLLVDFGWLLAADKVIVGCPVVLGPAIVLALRRTIAPLVAAVAGAAADVRFAFFAAPQPPYFGSLLAVAGVGAVAVLAGMVAWRWTGARGGRIAVVLILGATPLVGGFVLSARTSVLPPSYGMNMAGPGTSVAGLTGPAGNPDVQFTLTASAGRVKAGGLDQDALTFNGIAPGPELRVTLGQLVEVTLVNKDVAAGVTVHWHGLNVPNAEDGVAGVTQDAVRPGGRLVYRFRPAQTGTFWYHSHQDSRAEVEKGLYGALIVNPPMPAPALDVAAIAHSWPDVNVVNASTVDRRRAAPGRLVRVRLIDTDSWPVRFAVSGTPFRVAAIDGSAVHDPGEVVGQGLLVPAGGRLDVLFTMPPGPVTVTAFADAHNRKSAGRGIADPALVFSSDGLADPAPAVEPDADVDFSAYGAPAPTPFGVGSRFGERETYYLDYGYRFHDGGFRPAYTLNGELFPRTPMLMVHEGDLVELTFVNRSVDDHAMHLHGHTMLVLARDGRAVSGSPWWTDTLNVAPGETFTVAFRADNPGVWMDHCHNFGHAAGGMTMHLAYAGVTDPYRAGAATGNDPE